MTRTLLLTLLLISTLPAVSQIVGDRVNKYVAKHSIDTFIVYSLPCSGYISFLDSCYNDISHYLFWQQSGVYYLKRFDYCKAYRTLTLDALNPLAFYLTNEHIIDSEQIRQPTYYEIRKKKKTVDTLMYSSTVSHSCFHTFQISLANMPKYISVDIYDLEFKMFDDGKQNIYYDYNQMTKLKVLIDQTVKFIKHLETDKKFENE